MKVPYEKIVEKIKEETGLDEHSIELKVENKQKELSGLVSKTGAAHIVANKLGINLIENLGEERLKIKNLTPGLRSIDVAGKITRIWEPKEFETKKGKKGQVGSFLLQDETGKVRVVIWDKRVKWLDSGKLSRGKAVEIRGGYVKDGKYGLELHLRSDSKVEFELEDVDVEISEASQGPRTERKKIEELESDERAEIRAAMVSIFSNNLFYKACPECMKKLRDGECPEHGEVEEPDIRMVLSAVFDDGTGTVRTTFFGKSAEILLGRDTEEAYEVAEEEGNQELINKSLPELLGKEMILKGQVKKNERYDRLDFVVNNIIRNPKPEITIKKLIRKTNKNK